MCERLSLSRSLPSSLPAALYCILLLSCSPRPPPSQRPRLACVPHARLDGQGPLPPLHPPSSNAKGASGFRASSTSNNPIPPGLESYQPALGFTALSLPPPEGPFTALPSSFCLHHQPGPPSSRTFSASIHRQSLLFFTYSLFPHPHASTQL